MSELASARRTASPAVFAMFAAALAMLFGFGYVLYQSYETAKVEAVAKAPTPPLLPEKDKAPPVAKEASLGDAFIIARTNPWFWWTLCNAITLAGLGALFAIRKPTHVDGEEAEKEEGLWRKLGFFAIASVIGFFTVVCLALPFTWIKSADILSREGWKNREPWLVILAYVLGLGSMFASLLAVKSEERTSVNIRRWIYGYNAFLGGLLFLAILGVINAWFALYGPEASDWTATNIYSISPATKRILKSVDKPIRAYVILPFNDIVQEDMVNLLKASKGFTDQLDIVELSPNRNPKEVDKLITQYSLLRDETGSALGVLLVQDPDTPQAQHTFIKFDDLEEMSGGGMRGGDSQRLFKGEQALYTALRDFREGKKKVTIYFTQDSGELSIDEAARGRREVAPNRSAVGLKTKLEQAGYLVKPLNLGEREVASTAPPAVPEDALVVVVADPLRMTPEKASVLDAYLKRPKKEGTEPGKLVVLLDVHFGSDGKVLHTSLENLLLGAGVQVGQNFVMGVSRRDPTILTVVPTQGIDPDIAQSLVGILQTTELEFNEARSLTILPGSGPFEAKGLLYAFSEAMVRGATGRIPAVWTEEKQIADPAKYVRDLVSNPQELIKKVGPQPVALAATVRDRSAPTPPPNQFSPPPPQKLGAPRLAVFGDANFATDANAERGGDVGVNLMLTTLAWVRGKPELAMDVPPKERKAYRMVMTPDTLNRVLYYPILWILLAIIATGIGVGILRRR